MASTQIVIASSGQTFTLPGDHWTAAQVASTFADSVPGIGAMTPEETRDGNGDKRLTFRARTGTKG